MQGGSAPSASSASPLRLAAAAVSLAGTAALVWHLRQRRKRAAQCDYALGVQAPWTTHMLSGWKTIETRYYDLPPELLGKWLLLLEERQGQAGVATLADHVAPGTTKVVGKVKFSECIVYPDKAAWAADEKRHRVPVDNGYGWKEGKQVRGWVVGDIVALEPCPGPPLVRMHRSIFQVDTLPTADLTPFLCGGTLEEKMRVVDMVRAQVETVGFMRVAWKDFPEALVADVHERLRHFFALPPEEKKKSSKEAVQKKTKSATSTGFRDFDSTFYNRNRQSWSCIQPSYAGKAEGYYTGEAGQKYFALPPDPQVVWPAEDALPGFQKSVCEYYAMVERVGDALFRIFALALDKPEDFFLKLADKHVSSLNAYSFELGKGPDVLAAHGDITAFTVITYDNAAQAAGSACLEMLDVPEQRWRTVEAMPNTCTVNIGQIMERWSGGRFKATMHRVTSPKNMPAGATRQSLVFFYATNHDVVLEPLCDCVVPVKYEPEAYPDYVGKRIGGFYQKDFDEESAWEVYNADILYAVPGHLANTIRSTWRGFNAENDARLGGRS